MLRFEQHTRYAKLRQQDLMSQAERHRLAQEARTGRLKFRFYHPVMARFGRWLVASGYRLQRRYGQLSEMPQVKPQVRAAQSINLR